MRLKGELTSAEQRPIMSQRSPYVMSSTDINAIARLLLVGLRMSLYVFRISLEVFSFDSK